MPVRACMVLVVAALPWLSGCAFDLTDVHYTPARLEAAASPQSFITLKADAKIDRAPCGYRRVLRAGTRWELVGTLPEGRVYRSPDQEVTLECSNVFEAYPVVTDSRVVGFYLPVEKGLVLLPGPIGFTNTNVASGE